MSADTVVEPFERPLARPHPQVPTALFREVDIGTYVLRDDHPLTYGQEFDPPYSAPPALITTTTYADRAGQSN